MSVRSWIQGALALEVLLGLTWMVGFFFLNQQSVAVAYVFTVLNSTQGLFIFVFHCLLNKKVGLPAARSVETDETLEGPGPLLGCVLRQRDKTYGCYGSGQTLTSPSDSVCVL